VSRAGGSPAPEPWRPTREELAAAAGRTVPDVIGPGLDVLFIGINPGLYSGAVGHHFARPGNRFWKTLHGAGFTHRVLSPFEERELLQHGVGITNLVERATRGADDLGPPELRAGAERVRAKACRHRPRFAAFLGLGAYRSAFGAPKATVGRRDERICDSLVWVLPNPSGLNANYQLGDLISAFRDLREAVGV
jgi:TDG/mug DNA glycosylase family protein